MTSWEQVFPTWPILQTIVDGLIIMIPGAALLAFSGIYFISATAKIISVSTGRSAFNKCSRQTALLGLILGWSLLVGSRVYLYLNRPGYNLEALDGFMIEMSWLLLSLGVLFSSIYYCLWRILKNMPVLHSTLGVISAVQNCLALIAILFTIRLLAGYAHPEAATLALPDLFPDAWNAPIWSAAAYSFPLMMALAGGSCACWLVLRRNRDDFGRDYYNRFLPWCAAWARNCWLILWLLLAFSTGLKIWIQTKTGEFTNDEGILDIGRVLVWLIPLLLWNATKRSRLPMRQSWALFLALILASLFVIPWFLELTEISGAAAVWP